MEHDYLNKMAKSPGITSSPCDSITLALLLDQCCAQALLSRTWALQYLAVVYVALHLLQHMWYRIVVLSGLCPAASCHH